jgi:dCMP deaminase
MTLRWDRRYLELARLVSTWSKDPNKQVGAVITDQQYVRGVGFNGFPRGIEDTPHLLEDKKMKLQIVVHAEVNAILAARGIGDTIYIWPCLPCTQCSSLIIQAGIKRVVSSLSDKSAKSRWNKDLACDLLQQVGMEVNYV